MDTGRKEALISSYRNGLLNETLPFWIKHCVDYQHGGFMMSLNRDGTVIDTDKGVWQQGRFTWLLGEMTTTSNREKNGWNWQSTVLILLNNIALIRPMDGCGFR